MVGIDASAGANGMDVDGGSSGRRLSVGYQALSAKQLGMEVSRDGNSDDVQRETERSRVR